MALPKVGVRLPGNGDERTVTISINGETAELSATDAYALASQLETKADAADRGDS